MYVNTSFIGIGKRFEFTANEAIITYYTNPQREERLPLKITYFPADMLPDVALNTERAVSWFFKNDYIPTVVGIAPNQSVTFLQNSQTPGFSQSTAISKTLEKFLKLYDENPKNSALNEEPFAEWSLLRDNLGASEFTLRVELMRALMEEFCKSLPKKEYTAAEECLEALHTLTLTNFIFKELYADFLGFRKSPKACELYLQLSGRLIGEASLPFLEKAVRSDPEQALQRISEAKCSEEHRLHCYLSGLLACADKTSEVARTFYSYAMRINKDIKDPLMKHVHLPKSVDLSRSNNRVRDTLESSQSVSWSPASPKSDTRSTTNSPATVRIGRLARSSQDAAKKKEVEQTEQEYLQQLATGRDPNTWLEKLLWLYLERENWPKTEFIAKKLYCQLPEEHLLRHKIGCAEAKSLEMQGKTAESRKRYLEVAKDEYNQTRKANVASCLIEIEQLTGSFDKQDEKIRHLLSRAVRKNFRLCIDSSRETPHTAPTTVKSKAHFGEWSYFQIDTPPYVACAFTPSIRFLFTKTTVEVLSFVNDCKSGSYSLEIADWVPLDIALFSGASIRWLLANGYIPAVSNGRVEFCEKKPPVRLLAQAETARLHEFKTAFKEGAIARAHYILHTAYTTSKKAEEITNVYAEFLLYIQKPKVALELFLELAKLQNTNEKQLYYHERALYAACMCKDETTEAAYNTVLRLLKHTKVPKQRRALLMLHGYLHFQCHDAFKNETMMVEAYKNDKEFTALLQTDTPRSVAASPRSLQVLDCLFSNTTIVLKPNINARNCTTYLENYEEQEKKEVEQVKRPKQMLSSRGAVLQNSICTACRSRALFYLEHALDLAIKEDDPQAATIYEKIYAKFQSVQAPAGTQFLLCLHAFFYLYSRQPEAADGFFQRANELNATSPLLGCARMVVFPDKAASEYAKIVSQCASKDTALEHRQFLGEAESWLEAYVKKECELRMEQAHLAEMRRSGLAEADSLIERERAATANNVLDKLPPGSVAILKRKLFVYKKLGNKPVIRSTLDSLKERYTQKQYPEKLRTIEKLYDALGVKTEDEQINELFEANKEPQAAICYLGFAFEHICNDDLVKAQDCLGMIKELDPDHSHFDDNQKLMLQLIQDIIDMLIESQMKELNL